MFGKYSQGGNASSLNQRIAGLGSAIGLGAAILVTPIVFSRTAPFITDYLCRYLGRNVTGWVTLAAGAIEAYIIFCVVSLLFSFAVTLVVATFASRRFSDRL